MAIDDSTQLDGETSAFDVSLDFPARVVTVRGDLDMATAPVLLSATECLLIAPTGEVTIDLAGITFLDSVGLGALVQISNALGSHGERLVLINPTARQRRLFMIVGLAGFLAAP